MTPERIAGWIVVAVLLVLLVWFLVVVIERIDEDDGNPGLVTGGWGWEV